jgi:hypothetical protein
VAAPIADVTSPGTAGSASATSLSINKPGGVVDNDLLIALVQHRTAGGSYTTVPSGWTSIAQNSTNHTWGVWHKAIPSASGESATSYSWTVSSAASRMCGLIFRVTGAHSTPIDSTGANASNSGTTQVAIPAVTAVTTQGLLIECAMHVQQTTGTISNWSPPAGTSAIVQANGGGTSGVAAVGAWAGYETLSASGSTGTRTPTVSPAVTNTGGVAFIIAPTSTVVPTFIFSTVVTFGGS